MQVQTVIILGRGGGVIRSVETFGPGDYVLMFDRKVSALVVSLGSFSQPFFTPSGESIVQPFTSGIISLTAPAQLVFAGGSITPNTGGSALIDNITLRRIEQTAPVPEPTTMLLLGTGLAGVVAAVRKKRKKE